MIRVFLLDDHEVVRRGVRDLLEGAGDICVVGEAATEAEAVVRLRATAPDVAVLDVRLQEGSGIEVCRAMRADLPTLRCLMLTSYDDDDVLFEAIMAGAVGFLLKEVCGSDLVDSVRRVAGGQSLIDPRLTAAVLDRLRNPTKRDERLGSLTDQERKILELLAEGRSNREIGEVLFLAEKTVKNHMTNLLGKLGMQRRTEAAVYAARLAERRARR